MEYDQPRPQGGVFISYFSFYVCLSLPTTHHDGVLDGS
jgi:hypothetical protein